MFLLVLVTVGEEAALLEKGLSAAQWGGHCCL